MSRFKQITIFLILLALLILPSASYSMNCSDKTTSNIFTGDQKGHRYYGVSFPTDRMYIWYSPDANSTGSNIDTFEHNFGASRQLAWWWFGTHWDSTVRARTSQSTFDAQASMSSPITAAGGTPIVCFRRIKPDGACPEGGRNPDRLPKVCGYVVWNTILPCDSDANAWGGWDHARFGCVHEPLKPPPPPFNEVMVAPLSANVLPYATATDAVEKLGSTFHQPKVRISDGVNTVDLVYDYTSIDSTTQMPKLNCQKILDSNGVAKINISYCAEVPQDAPYQICVCPEGQCANTPNNTDGASYLGCIPRPTPKQSNLKMMAFYQADAATGAPMVTMRFLHSNLSGDLCLGKTSNLLDASKFCDGGTKISHQPDNYYTPKWDSNKYPVSYYDPGYNHSYLNGSANYNPQADIANLGGLPFVARTGLTSLPYFKEYYLNQSVLFFDSTIVYSSDDGSPILADKYRNNAFYDVTFIPYIPKVNDPISLVKNAATISGTTTCQIPELRDFSNLLNGEYMGSTYAHIQYSRERNGINNTSCKNLYANDGYSFCDPQVIPATVQLGAERINRAICPGIFTNSDIAHKICFSPDPKTTAEWPDFNAELLDSYHDLCANIPPLRNPSDPAGGCNSERPSPANDYINWPYLALNSQKTDGSCDASLGLEARVDYYLAVGSSLAQTCPNNCNAYINKANEVDKDYKGHLNCLEKCALNIDKDTFCSTVCANDSKCISNCTQNAYNTFITSLNNIINPDNESLPSLASRRFMAKVQNRNLLPAERDFIDAKLKDLDKVCLTGGNYTGCTAQVTSPSRLVEFKAYNMPIQKFCLSNGNTKRNGACVYKSTCDALTNTERFLGYLKWPAPPQFTTTGLSAPDNFNIKSKVVSQSTTECSRPSGGPSQVGLSGRSCTAFYDSNNNLLGSFWSDVDFNQQGVIDCVGNKYN